MLLLNITWNNIIGLEIGSSLYSASPPSVLIFQTIFVTTLSKKLYSDLIDHQFRYIVSHFLA